MTTPLLTVRGLSATHVGGVSGSARPALKELDFSVAVGSPMVVLGPTGSGKTALLRLLTGGIGDFETTGTALLNGEPITTDHHVEFVIRRPAILGGTIAEAVDPNGRKGAVQVVLHALDLPDFLHPLTRPMLDLTPFEIRLALLVRQAILRPQVVAFDEPTYGLSEDELVTYCRTLRALSKRIGVMVATRRPEVAEALAGALIVLEEGVIVRRAESPEIPSEDAPKTRRKKTFQTCDSYVPPPPDEQIPVIALPPTAPTPRSIPRDRETSAFPIFVVAPDDLPEGDGKKTE